MSAAGADVEDTVQSAGAADASGGLPPHRDPVVQEASRRVLADLADLGRSLLTATVLTDDGFTVARRPETDDGDRMASMASSIQALGEAVARELEIGSGEFVIIASDRGHVIQRRVPGTTLVLAALFDVAETLGKALATSRLAAERLAGAVDDATRAAATGGEGGPTA